VVVNAVPGSIDETRTVGETAKQIQGLLKVIGGVGTKISQVVKGFFTGISKFVTKWDAQHPLRKFWSVLQSLLLAEENQEELEEHILEERNEEGWYVREIS